jgi:hypothetical protein
MAEHRFVADRCLQCGEPPSPAIRPCFGPFVVLGVELKAYPTNWRREGCWQAEVPGVGLVVLGSSNPNGQARYEVRLWVPAMADWVTFPWNLDPEEAVRMADLGIAALLKLGARS